jgi:hypothetical protein
MGCLLLCYTHGVDMTTEVKGEPEGDEDEFAHIPPPRPRRSPLLAAAVLLVSGILLYHLRHEIRYALTAAEPVDLGDARALFGEKKEVPVGRHVTVSGQPDRRNALYVEPRGEKVRHTLFRLLGTDNRLFVRATDTAERHALADRWSGRIHRFADLPWGAALRDYYAREVRAVRFFDAAALEKAVAAGGPVEVQDRTGRPVSLTPDTEVTLDVRVPARVRIFLSRDLYATADDGRREVERLGLTVMPDYGTDQEYGFVVETPADDKGRDGVLAKLEARNIEFQLADYHLSLPLSRIRLGEGVFVLDRPEVQRTDGKRVPSKQPVLSIDKSQVRSANLADPIVVPADAYLLVEGETPGDYLWAPLLALLLLLFSGFNVWYLVRSRRPA